TYRIGSLCPLINDCSGESCRTERCSETGSSSPFCSIRSRVAPRLDLPAASKFFTTLNSAVKIVLIGLRYAVCRETGRLSSRKRSSHEFRKYRKGHRSASGNQDHRKLCRQSYTVTRAVAGPDHLGAAGSARSRKTG